MATSSDMLPPSEVAAGGYDQDRRARLQNHVLTAEELKALKECNRESFVYRALPLGLGAVVAVQYGTKMGYLTPHPKYGPYLKMIGAGFIGWIVGKFSYRRQCEEKLMKLPNSVIGEALRRKYGVAPSDSFRGSAGGQYTDYSSTLGQDGDLGAVSSQSLDLRSNTAPRGLDDSQRPSMDSSRSHTASQGLDDRQRPSIDSMRSSTSPQGLNDSERPSMDTDRSRGRSAPQGLDDRQRPYMDSMRSSTSPQGFNDSERPSMDSQRSRSHTAAQGIDDRQRPSVDSMRSSTSPQGLNDSDRPSVDSMRSSTSPQGLNDSERPSMDNPNLAEVPENLPPAKFSTSYEELRRRNREEYERRFSTPPPSSQQPAPPYQGFPERQERGYPPRQSTPGSAQGPGAGKKNKYGDSWEE